MNARNVTRRRAKGTAHRMWRGALLAATLASCASAPRAAPEAPSPPPEACETDNPAARGPEAGPNLVVFSDFECPHCARLAETLGHLQRAHPEVRIEFRHFPLPFHEHALLAHEAASEARRQGGDDAFWRFHDRLFESRELDREALLALGTELGLDTEALAAALDDRRHQSAIAADVAYGRGLGVRGTPTVLAGDAKLVGAQSESALVAALSLETEGADQARSRAAELPAATPQLLPIPAHAPRRGEGEVVVQVFSDFECPYCAGPGRQIVERVARTWPEGVQIVFRHFPLPRHPWAQRAAEVALEVRVQGGDEAFWRFHDLTFSAQDTLSEATLLAHAAEAGADPDAVHTALEAGRHREAVAIDVATARDAGARGTPTFFVDETRVDAGEGFLRIEELVDDALAP